MAALDTELLLEVAAAAAAGLLLLAQPGQTN